MPHPYPKPILPTPTPVDQWTVEQPADLPDGFLSDPRDDYIQRCQLRAVEQVRADALKFAAEHAGSTEAKSARGFAANLPGMWQLYASANVFGFKMTQALFNGTNVMYFVMTHGWRPICLDANNQPTGGGAFRGDNVSNGVLGVQVDEIYDLLFGSLRSDVRSGAYVLQAKPG